MYTFLYIGEDAISPYMMKLVDVVPHLLKKLPFHSLMRLCTEAGEHKHYENTSVFYHHTPRGGGRNKPSVLMLIFQRQWQILCYRIKNECPGDIWNEFKSTVAETIEQDKEDHSQEDDVPNVSIDDDTGAPAGPLCGKRFVLCGKLPGTQKTSQIKSSTSVDLCMKKKSYQMNATTYKTGLSSQRKKKLISHHPMTPSFKHIDGNGCFCQSATSLSAFFMYVMWDMTSILSELTL